MYVGLHLVLETTLPHAHLHTLHVVDAVLSIPPHGIESADAEMYVLRALLQAVEGVVEKGQERGNALNVHLLLVEEGAKEEGRPRRRENVHNVHLLAAEGDVEDLLYAPRVLLHLVMGDVKETYVSLNHNRAPHVHLHLVMGDVYLLSLLSTPSSLVSIHILFSTSFSALVMCGRKYFVLPVLLLLQ